MENDYLTTRDSSHEQIVPYDPEWVSWYEMEAENLKLIFGDSLLGIEHIGSTSVPGLAAKPIIDIAVLIAGHQGVDQFIPKLIQFGYPFNPGIHAQVESPERHFFRKGKPTKYHLSIAYQNRGSFWKRQLAFRDYLRLHPVDRDRYAELKQKLIQKDPTGKDSYIIGKTDLVNEILDKAGFIRWKPGDNS